MTYPIVHDGRMFTPDGRVDPPATAGPGRMLNCGHAAAKPSRVTPGFALIMDYTVCYACMDEWERQWMAGAPAYTGYVHGRVFDRGSWWFTTWTGGQLARITRHEIGGRIWMPYGESYRPRFVRAITPDGAEWWGRGTDEHSLITLRRVKVRAAKAGA